MATETLYANGTPTSTGNCTTPANAHGVADTLWAGTGATNSDWTHRWSMGDPVSGLTTGTQTISVTARKNGAGGADPTLTINLWENGVLVTSSIGSAVVTNTTSQTVTGTFPGSAITNRNNVEIELVSTHGGGSPAGRYEVQVNAITWTALVNDPPVTINPVKSTSASSSDIAQITAHAASATINPVKSTSASSSDVANVTASYLPMTVNPVSSTSASSSDVAQLTEPENVIATDDFNRADETLSASANWNSPFQTSPSIVSNTVQGPNNVTVYNAVHQTPMGSTDHWVEATVTTGVNYSEGNVLVRNDNTNETFYRADFNSGSIGTRYNLYKFVSGAPSVLASTSGPVAGSTRTIRLEVVGNTLTMYADGIEVLTYTDTVSPITTGTYVGLGHYRSGGTTAIIDNFSAGDWTTGLSPVTINPVKATSVSSSDVTSLNSPGTPTGVLDLAGTSGLSAGTVDLTWTEPIGTQ